MYLCSSKHNRRIVDFQSELVVNCFKMCIFAVASTIAVGVLIRPPSCELLQNVYLCSSKHNETLGVLAGKAVVNCFKMCIFAVASTIENKYCSDSQLVTLSLCKIKTAI